LPRRAAGRGIAIPRNRNANERTENAQHNRQLCPDLLQRGAAAISRGKPFRQSIDLPIVHGSRPSVRLPFPGATATPKVRFLWFLTLFPQPILSAIMEKAIVLAPHRASSRHQV
jgi:hypothetical protein